jgi:hypothetical protein
VVNKKTMKHLKTSCYVQVNVIGIIKEQAGSKLIVILLYKTVDLPCKIKEKIFSITNKANDCTVR